MCEQLHIDKVNEVRSKEMEIYGKYVNIKQVCSAIYFNAGTIISGFIFICTEKSKLELGSVFSTIALLGYVFNFSVLFSNYAIESIYTIVVFNKRVNDIILNAKKYAEVHAQSMGKVQVLENKATLKMKNITAVWSPSDQDSKPPIQDINLDFQGPMKVAVIGKVGCGKSTLFHTALKETYIKQGSVEIGSDSVALTEQNPLIITGTVESNILFGSKMDS